MRSPLQVGALGLGLLGSVLLLSSACRGPSAPDRVEWISADSLIRQALSEGSSEGGELGALPGDALFLAAGTSASLAILAPPSAELRIEGLAARGGAALEVELETDGGAARESVPLGPGRDLRLDLPSAQPLRLVLRVSGSPSGRETGVLLRRPSIWGSDREIAEPRDSPTVEGAPPPIVIYLIDTLRRDRLGCYGYERPITPEIDAFAARATLFEEGIGQSSWTKASVASIFTGVWPPVHGAISWKHRLSDAHDTLAERLERAGYATGAFSTNPNITEHFGFSQGFQEFFWERQLRSQPLNERIVAWLATLAPDQPFFLYAQPMDPHAGYNPPEEFLARHAPGVEPFAWKSETASWKWPVEALPDLEALYDAEIAANDASFGELLRELERRGLYDDALIVLTSDHGEEFQDHGGWRHGNNLYAETADIPLIVKFPGQTEGRRRVGPAQHVDILPTVLEAAGVPLPSGIEGRSLASEELEGRPVFSHLRLGGKPTHLTLVDGKWKLMQRHRSDGVDTLLFDRRRDPAELENVAADNPVRTAAMAAMLAERLAADASPEHRESVEIDAELEQSLRSLGYLD